MARVNVEECWWSDPRRARLIRLVGGDSRVADGLAMEAWRLGQEYWKHERMLIPLSHFENLEGGELLIQAKLAEVRDDAVYMRGSSQYLDWNYEKRAAAKKGGVEAAKRPRDERGQYLPKEPIKNPATTQAEPTQNPGWSKPPSPVPIPVPDQLQNKELKANFSNSAPEVDFETFELDYEPDKTGVVLELPTKNRQGLGVPSATLAKIPVKPPSDSPRFIAAYVTAYKARYGDTKPDLRGKIQGQIKQFLKDYPIDRACQLIQVYCQLDDKWFVTKMHDFTTFVENLNKVSYSLDLGVAAGMTNYNNCDFSLPGDRSVAQ